jgi:hypothetical protein
MPHVTADELLEVKQKIKWKVLSSRAMIISLPTEFRSSLPYIVDRERYSVMGK